MTASKVRSEHSPYQVSPAIVASGVFAALLFWVLFDSVRKHDRVVGWDRDFARWMTSWRGDALTTAMRGVTQLADTGVVIVGTVVLATALLVRYHRAAAILFSSSCGAAILVQAAKAVVQRQRPMGGLVTATGAACPSGHATQGVAFYCASGLIAATLVRRRWIRVAIRGSAAAIAIGVGLSRVVLGVHWLSDVVAGWCLGWAWLVALVIANRIVVRERRPQSDDLRERDAVLRVYEGATVSVAEQT